MAAVTTAAFKVSTLVKTLSRVILEMALFWPWTIIILRHKKKMRDMRFMMLKRGEELGGAKYIISPRDQRGFK